MLLRTLAVHFQYESVQVAPGEGAFKRERMTKFKSGGAEKNYTSVDPTNRREECRIARPRTLWKLTCRSWTYFAVLTVDTCHKAIESRSIAGPIR